MSVLGLVHGAGLGGWCWNETVVELAALGLRAAVVDLSLDDAAAGAERLSDQVVEAFSPLGELVLVGHSISGLVVPLAAHRLPATRLVFLHAALPMPGYSRAQQVQAERDMFNPEMLSVPPSGWTDEATVTRFLLHDCPADVARSAFGRLRPSRPGDRLLINEPTPLESWPAVPCSFIVCADDRTITSAWARRASQERLGVEPIEITGGHCPMLARPRELAEILGKLT
jgi:pimeloyl-ACP methyl ester carboxylesterase